MLKPLQCAVFSRRCLHNLRAVVYEFRVLSNQCVLLSLRRCQLLGARVDLRVCTPAGNLCTVS